MRPNSKVDLTGSRYYALSDRVKVLLLERLHGAPAPEVLCEAIIAPLNFTTAMCSGNRRAPFGPRDVSTTVGSVLLGDTGEDRTGVPREPILHGGVVKRVSGENLRLLLIQYVMVSTDVFRVFSQNWYH